MSKVTRAISPGIEQLRTVRRWAWRLVIAVLLTHYAAGMAAGLLYPTPDLVLVKAG